MEHQPAIPPPFGLIAEFKDVDQILDAARKTYKEGYRRIEAYSPFPVEGLARAIGMKGTVLPWIVLAGGILGGLAGYGLQYWVSVIEYPLNIGGRPDHSWPAFIPVTFECTILGAALSAVLGMLALNGLPRPYHPVFNVEEFDLASSDRFFLLILSRDEKFDLQATHQFLAELHPESIKVVDP